MAGLSLSGQVRQHLIWSLLYPQSPDPYAGSCLHAVRAIEYPRWEDFNYELPEGIKNRMHWLGDGQTYNEKTMTGDRKCYVRLQYSSHWESTGAWYLNDDELDIPPGAYHSLHSPAQTSVDARTSTSQLDSIKVMAATWFDLP